MLAQTASQSVGFIAQFTWIDWLVVVAYLAGTTWLGAAMAGRQATIRDFFLGGRRLPWWAISGSIVATEISALTFVSVPWIVFQPGGNLTYLQLGLIGSTLARIIVGYWLVPAYYQREIYSPYDYMGNRLGRGVRDMTTVLFTIGGLLGQSARVYLTAEVVLVLLQSQIGWLTATLGLNELAWAILLIMVVSVAWTLLGGMTTVIWTDVVLFLAFALGAAVALGAVVASLDGGVAEFFRVGWQATQSGVPWASWGEPQPSGAWGKFTLFDFDTSPTRAFTFWAALIASTWGGVGAFGTDQLMAQRMFCCKSPRDARWAIIGSSIAMLVTLLVALVGVGLFVYYQTHTPGPAGLELLRERKNGDRILPVFLVEAIPVGLKGLIVAAIFAAAISSVMGILTALSQTVQTAFYNPMRERALARRGVPTKLPGSMEAGGDSETDPAEHSRSVWVSRWLVVIWGVLLSLAAYAAQEARERYPSVLELGLSLAAYCNGALLAGFFLAFLPLGVNGRGFLWSAPMSVLLIFAVNWHAPWAQSVCWGGSALLMALWLMLERDRPAESRASMPLRGAAAALGCACVLATCHFGFFDRTTTASGVVQYSILAWPWHVPLGSLVALAWGVWLGDRRAEHGSPAAAHG